MSRIPPAPIFSELLLILLLPLFRSHFSLRLKRVDPGVPRLELGLSVLETDVLTIDTIPLQEMMNDERGTMN